MNSTQHLTGLVFDIQRFSLHNGPGIRTTIFLKGCPLACQWCHNPESQSYKPEIMFWENRCLACGACVDACPEDAIQFVNGFPKTDFSKCTYCAACVDVCYANAREMVGKEMTPSQVLEEIKRDLAFYDESGGGVSFSGGEPLGQPEFLLSILRACRAEDIHTVVDTSGFARWSVFERIAPYVNLFLYDFKSFDAEIHRNYTGVSNELILENLTKLSELNSRIILRMPIIPGINDSVHNLSAAAEFIAGLPQVEEIDLLAYHQIATDKYKRINRPYLLDLEKPSPERMEEIAVLMRRYGLNVKIGA